MNESESTVGAGGTAAPSGFQETDAELLAWRAAWQTPAREEGLGAEPLLPETLRRQVRRRSLGLRLVTAGEALLTLAAIVVLGRLAQTLGTPLDLFTMTTLALLALGAFGFSLWNRWGLWRPSAESTAAYLDLSLLRCRRRVRGLRAGWGLLALQVILFVPWIGHRLGLGAEPPAQRPGPLAAYGFLALVAGLAAAILLALGRRTRRELKQLEEMRRDLIDAG